jgi:superfamily II DNA/RNA helicase
MISPYEAIQSKLWASRAQSSSHRSRTCSKKTKGIFDRKLDTHGNFAHDHAMKSLTELDLLPSLQKTLKEKGFTQPTEIQTRIIPLMLSGESVVGISETGSGKTLAYALPILHQLKDLENRYDAVLDDSAPRAVIVVPTRELGEQVAKVFKTLTHETRLRVRAALGGMPLEQAKRNVAGVFDILLATPGRLVQLLKEDLIHLEDVRTLIFDEADQMMDEGFKSDSNRIAEACPDDLQLGLFSATVTPAVQELMDSLFTKANIIKSAGSGKVVKTLITKNLTVLEGKRWPVLEKVLAKPCDGGTLLFTNTREQCDRIAKELNDKGYPCAIYRGEMDKNERRQNLKKFREGKISLLVATDVAARGIDIEHVGRVINYHLPQKHDNYLHRVGRTARAGREGLVINLVTERDEPLMAKLEGRAERPIKWPKNQPASKTPSASKGKPGLKSKPGQKANSKSEFKTGSQAKRGPKSQAKTKPGAKPSGKPHAKANARPSKSAAQKPRRYGKR